MAASDKVPAAQRKSRSLPLELWPQADRSAWTLACQPGTRLKRGGAAGHLKPITREDHAQQYGNFLGFLDRCGWLRRDGPPAANVTHGYVKAYLNELKDRLASTTLHCTICRLRPTARYIAPSRDFGWLYEVRQGKRRPAKARNGDNGSIAEGPPHRPGSRARTGLLGSMRSLVPSKDVTAVGRHQFPRAERGKGKRRRRGAYATLPQPGNNEEDQGRCSLAIQITPGGMAQFPICRRSGQPPPPIG